MKARLASLKQSFSRQWKKILPVLNRAVHKIKSFLKTRKGKWITAFLILGTWYWFCLPSNLFSDPICTVLVDKDGKLLGAKISSDGQWRFPGRTTVPYKFAQCIVQYEDRSFYHHPGFNPLAFGRAMKQNLKNKRIVSGEIGRASCRERV